MDKFIFILRVIGVQLDHGKDQIHLQQSINAKRFATTSEPYVTVQQVKYVLQERSERSFSICLWRETTKGDEGTTKAWLYATDSICNSNSPLCSPQCSSYSSKQCQTNSERSLKKVHSLHSISFKDGRQMETTWFRALQLAGNGDTPRIMTPLSSPLPPSYLLVQQRRMYTSTTS